MGTTVGRRPGLAFAATALLVGSAVAAVSEPVLVDGDLRSVHWATVLTNAVPLAWEWNAAATRAELEIAGIEGTFVTNFTSITSNYLWRAFATDIPASENAYTLTLTFYTNGNGVAEALTSRLAVVAGAFGAAAVNAVSNSPVWAKVRGNVVIPYDAAFAEAATNAANAQLVIAKVGGAVQTNALADTVGYVGWKIRNSDWGYGAFDLSLTFPGTAADALTAELERPMDGTMIRMR